MSLKNNYAYIRDCCGSFIWKHSLLELKESALDGKGETSSMSLQAGGNGYNGGVNGYLYQKTTIKHCCGAPIYVCCCMRSSFEVEGYNIKLAETKIPQCDICVCTPEYEVVDAQDKSLGHMKHNCIGIFFPNCRNLSVTTFNRPQTYVVQRPYCIFYPCWRRWEAKDGAGNMVAEITADYGLLFCRANYQLNFFGNMSNQDKLLFLSTIPFLP